MNPFELGAALRPTLAFGRTFALYAIALLAVPIVDDGVERAAAGPGARVMLDGWVLTAELQLGIVGDPFDVKGVLSAGYVLSAD
jgi:hypothetical protein